MKEEDFILLFKDSFNSADRNFLQTPYRWDGIDFLKTLEQKLDGYKIIVNKFFVALSVIVKDFYNSYKNRIYNICERLLQCIEIYYKGLPQKAYLEFEKLIKKNFDDKIRFSDYTIYWMGEKTFYRAVPINDNRQYGRDRCFHVPYNMREKVSTSRYSIPGHPSLYLSDSLELCVEEVNINSNLLFSRFELKQDNNTKLEVVDLSLEIEDIIKILEKSTNIYSFSEELIFGFLMRLPIQIACSFMRTDRTNSFAVEYVIPQLLMQWVKANADENSIVGIKYKSCANKYSSKLGNNYVFPSSGIVQDNNKFCPTLSKKFYLTKPLYSKDYESLEVVAAKLGKLEMKNVNYKTPLEKS